MEVSGRINTQKCTEKSCMAAKGDSKLGFIVSCYKAERKWPNTQSQCSKVKVQTSSESNQ